MEKKKKETRKFVNVIDLEACCWRGNPPKGQSKEIIEIGIASVDFYTKEIIKKRSILVKPKHSEISAFCTELTTITQEMVDKKGVSFEIACKILVKEFNSNKSMFVSWGEYDKDAFKKECRSKKTPYPFGKTHINLEKLFAFKYGLKQPASVSGALKLLDMEFTGTKHRGISDAINTARILQKII